MGPRLKQVLQPSMPEFPLHLEKEATFQNSIFRYGPDKSKWRVQSPVLAAYKLFSSFSYKKIHH